MTITPYIHRLTGRVRNIIIYKVDIVIYKSNVVIYKCKCSYIQKQIGYRFWLLAPHYAGAGSSKV